MKCLKFFQRLTVILLLLVGTLEPRALSSEGNGSSGVGNGFRKPVGEDFAFNLPKDSIDVIDVPGGYQVLDQQTGEQILSVQFFPRKDLSKFGDKLVPATLGKVIGQEFVPERYDTSKNKTNFWIVCPDSGECLLLTPTSNTNIKVLSAIGTLSQ